MKRNKFLLLNYVFVVSIILLFINDHFLKLHFHNFSIVFGVYIPKIENFFRFHQFCFVYILEISIFRWIY